MNAEYKDGKILNFKPVDDQEDIKNINRALNLKHPLLQELKDEFNKVILQLEESDDGFRATEEPDYINKGWIEGLRFAITIINTKMKEEE